MFIQSKVRVVCPLNFWPFVSIFPRSLLIPSLCDFPNKMMINVRFILMLQWLTWLSCIGRCVPSLSYEWSFSIPVFLGLDVQPLSEERPCPFQLDLSSGLVGVLVVFFWESHSCKLGMGVYVVACGLHVRNHFKRLLDTSSQMVVGRWSLCLISSFLILSMRLTPRITRSRRHLISKVSNWRLSAWRNYVQDSAP